MLFSDVLMRCMFSVCSLLAVCLFSACSALCGRSAQLCRLFHRVGEALCTGRCTRLGRGNRRTNTLLTLRSAPHRLLKSAPYRRPRAIWRETCSCRPTRVLDSASGSGSTKGPHDGAPVRSSWADTAGEPQV